MRLPLIKPDPPPLVLNPLLDRLEILGNSALGIGWQTVDSWVHPFILAITKRGRAAALAASARQSGKLNLGSGSHIREGWTNVDLSPGLGGFVWDLTRSLPVDNGSIHYIFTEHFIEHLTLTQGITLLTECRRILRDDGVLRISTPNLRFLIEQYTECCVEEWCEVGWSPKTPCAMVNEGLHLWGHKFMYDEPELILLLREAGFTRIRAATWHESAHAPLRGLEVRRFHHELICEAQA